MASGAKEARLGAIDLYTCNHQWRAGLDSIAVSRSTNSIRRQDPNIFSDTETRALSREGELRSQGVASRLLYYILSAVWEIQIARSRMRRKKRGIFLKWRHMIKVRMGMEKG